VSYLVIRVYSFECDRPGCEEVMECGGPYIADALRELRSETTGWTVVKGKHYCRRHKPA
jgi:hypothetical protein